MRRKAQGAVSVRDCRELEKTQNVLCADFRAVPVCVPRAEKILFIMMVLVFMFIKLIVILAEMNKTIYINH